MRSKIKNNSNMPNAMFGRKLTLHISLTRASQQSGMLMSGSCSTDRKTVQIEDETKYGSILEKRPVKDSKGLELVVEAPFSYKSLGNFAISLLNVQYCN